jgi:signal transduction histidine kinase
MKPSDGPHDAHVSDFHARGFVRKYRLALVIVALFVLLDEALVQPALTRLTSDAPLLNVAGRQRMLSQRLAKAALALQWRRSAGEAARLDELREVVDQWSRSHDRLREGGARTTWVAPNSHAVQDSLDDLTPLFLRMREAADRLIRDGASGPVDPAASRRELAVILENEAEYLSRMDRIVQLYELEARGRVERLRRIGWVLAALTLAGLAAIGRLVLHPAVLVIRRQVSELGIAREELEARVRERTRELESARQRHHELLEQLGHAGRTTSMGETASALAHELNQPLGAIANYAEGCLIALRSPRPELDEVRRSLERLLAATMRCGQIIERVRRFVTRQDPVRERFEANRVAQEVVELLHAEAQSRGVAVTLDLAQGLPWLSGDPVQIQQVLVNLARNAFEALAGSQPQAPSLVIRTCKAEARGVEFRVSDNGEGIPADQSERVFDPYFSTRAGGMGMGLAICRTIVEAHHGRIWVESEPGARTMVRFEVATTADGDEGDAGTDGLHRGR